MAENAMGVGSSAKVAAAAIELSLSFDRETEKALREKFAMQGYRTAAVDFGGEFIPSINKIIERAVVAAKREGIIDGSHLEEGAVAGAAREAVSQIINKAIGLNVGGKIGIARAEDHVSVAMFFRIGLLHLNEVAIGLGHRAI
jgi:hypothetical protein